MPSRPAIHTVKKRGTREENKRQRFTYTARRGYKSKSTKVRQKDASEKKGKNVKNNKTGGSSLETGGKKWEICGRNSEKGWQNRDKGGKNSEKGGQNRETRGKKREYGGKTRIQCVDR